MDKSERGKLFGNYLHDAQLKISERRHKIINQSDMAREAKVSQPSFAHWYNGDFPPMGDNAVRIAVYLWRETKEIKAFEILEMPVPVPEDNQLKAVLTLLLDKTPDQIAMVIEYIKRIT
jgi:predicted transcriptional regulator